MPRSHMLNRVGFIKHNKIIFENDAALSPSCATEHCEKKRVIQNDDVRRQNGLARPLEETNATILGEIRPVSAKARRAEPAFRTDLVPDFGVRLDVEIRAAAVGRLL